MRSIPLLLMVMLVLPVAADAASQAGKPPVNRSPSEESALAERIETDIIRYQKTVPKIFDTLEALKKAKASYIQELTVPTNDVSRYRTAASRRQLVGVYLFDMSYASVFDRKKQVVAALDAVQYLLKGLGISDRKVEQQYQRLVREYGSSTMKHLVMNYENILNDSLQEFAQSGDGIAMVTDAAYGWLIEGLYVTAEIVAQQNYSPLMLYRINEQAECIKPVVALLESVKSNPRLSPYVASGEYLTVLNAVSSALKTTDKISRTEVDSVRTIVTKARAQILK